MDARERDQLLVAWNATARDYPRDTCLHELVEAQVDRSPSAIALVLEGAQLTYRELDARANQLAHHLIALGAGPEVKVGVFVERSIEMVIGILGILKAGAAYVPLETKSPAERLAFLLADASAALVVTQDRLLPQLRGLSARFVTLDRDAASMAGLPTTRPSSGVRAENLAYVIYTSGSTGKPKGVQIEHRQIVNQVTASGAVEGIKATDRVLQFSSIAFDSSVEELFTPLAHGATMVLRGEEVPSALELFGARYAGVTVMNMATAYWHAIAAALEGQALTPPAGLRMINIGGERALPEYLRRWHELFPGCALNNQYGPTETTVMATAWRLERDQLLEGREAPIGRPLPNYTVYVLDARGEPVPVGVNGELYIGGESVARGYLDRPELTAEKFVTNPFGPGRLYRTSDLVRWRADGNLEFQGRVDDQVKIRGFRIELGEIEMVFAEHPAVQNVAVLARAVGGGEKQLVAYVVLGAAATVGELGEHVRARLPAYMVPARLVVVDEIPITATGKVNKAALPDVPGEALAAPRTYEPPEGELEQMLAGIWCELLDLDEVGRHDNFFELGGHSLMAMRMLAQLRRVGRTVEVRTLFGTPTLSALASALQGHRELSVPPNVIAPGSTTITPAQLPLIDLTQADIERIGAVVPGGLANVQDIYALAPLQEGILFHHQLATAGDPYLVVQQFAFPDRALLDRYIAATQQVIDRHDIMRTAFVWESLSVPAQVVLRSVSIIVTEIAIDEGGPDPFAQLAGTFDPRRDRFDLTQAPLIRYAIAQEPGSGRWLVRELSHHLIGDHESLELMRAEVELLMTGREQALAEPYPFRNLVAAATLGVNPEAHELYFRALLGNVDEPSSPFGILDAHQDGTGMVEAHRQLPTDVSRRLRAAARPLGLSVATLCHVAWGQVVARTTGRTQVVFGTVLFGRMQVSNADSALGLYMNTLPIRLDLDDTSVVETARRAHAVLAELVAHEHASLGMAQRCSGVAPPTPLFSSLLNYRHSAVAPAAEDLAHHALAAVEWLGGEERTNFPFMVSVDDVGAELGLRVQAVEPVSADRVCAMMARALEELADALEHAPHTPVRALDVMPPDERQQLLVDWNATERDYPQDLCLHEMFEAQVDRTPAAVAVEFEGSQLTYAELDRRANQVAHHLRAVGVGPGVLVGIFVERSLDMVVALYGVLKAGAAYVPLDPSYPRERLAFTIDDAAMPVLLTQARVVDLLPDHGARVVRLDADWAEVAQASTERLGRTARPSDRAYVIFTSGSTGRPKGVMVPHRAVVNFLCAMQRAPGIAPTDTLLAVTTLSFDIAGLELYLPLVAGAKVVIASRETARDGQLLAAQIEACGATVMQATPATWRMLVASDWRAPARLRVLCGGEAMPAELAASLLADAASVWNLYGPTETTIWSTCAKLEPGAPITIGRAIDNTKLYVLDAERRPVPVGVAGELYIGGHGVALGYHNRPELTAERFMPDPFATEPDARMYRTGDLVRWGADGTLAYLGRGDAQIKLRGFRIELGEIEAVLAAHASVREVVVLAREDSPGDKRLVAYVVGRDGVPEVAALRTHASASLPEYMVPAAFVVLETMPLTPNGKVDRKALPAPDLGALSQRAYVAPWTPTEIALSEIWCHVLGTDRVGVRHDFFELGGHSLLAVQAVTRVRERLGVRLPLAALFQARTIEALARVVDELGPTSPARYLVPISAAKSGTPSVVCVHALGGTSGPYLTLGALIGRVRGVDAIESRGLFGGAPWTSIPEMAAHYAGELIETRGTGAVHLLGYSFGGLVVYEMRHHLVSAGVDVLSTTMLDPQAPAQPGADLGDPAAAVLSGLGHGLGLDLSEDELARPRHEVLAMFAERARVTGQWGASVDVATLATYARVMEAHMRAARSYVPEPTHDRIVVVNTVGAPDDADGTEEWRRYAPNLEVHTTPGTHQTMIETPHVEVLYALLEEIWSSPSRR
ncbi:MAG: amino acid adenylation domain-containing protein [Kofleriaceae bacterium]|nr:amino acid adenylation domain-containing protein [Kofleriaceae bacterium]